MIDGHYVVLVEPVFGEEWETYGPECTSEAEAYAWARAYATKEPHHKWAIMEVIDTSTDFAERGDEWEEA